MSSLINDIQTIAKTKLLEEKVSKALAQSDSTLNNNVGQSPVPTERSIGLADGTTATGTTTNNTTTLVVTGGTTTVGDPSLGLGYTPASQAEIGNPNNGGLLGNIGIAGLTGGLSAAQEAANQVAAANGVLNQTNSTTPSQSGGKSGTDMTGSASGNGAGASGGGDTSAGGVGGSNGVAVATNGASDPILSGLLASPVVTNSSTNDQLTMTLDYTDQNYNSPGIVTAAQIVTGVYPSSYNPLQQPLNGVIGFDPNGTISAVTASIMAIKVQLYYNGTFPTPSPADALNSDQGPWSSPSVPPTYTPPTYQTGYYWYGQNSLTTNIYSQSIENAMAAAQAFIISTVLVPGDVFVGLKCIFTIADSISHDIGDCSSFASLYPPGVGFQWRFNYYHLGSLTFAQCSGGFVKCPSSDPGTDPSHTMCFLGPPSPITATAWPKTGLSILTLTNGQVGYSPYDSELPTYLKQPRSYVKLAAGDGVHVINSNYLTIQPGINGGVILSVLNSSGAFQFANYYDDTGILKQAQLSLASTALYIP